MIKTISKGEFRDEFRAFDRLENFSYEGMSALYDWLEDLDGAYELDVIALCCEYNEDKIEDVLREHELKDIEELEEQTCVIWRDEKRVLYQCF